MPSPDNKENENLNPSLGRALGEKGFELKYGLAPDLSPAATAAFAPLQTQQSATANASTNTLQPKPQPKSPCPSCASAGRTGPCPGHGGGGGPSEDNTAKTDPSLDNHAVSDEHAEKLDLPRLVDAFEFTVNPENGTLSIAPKPGTNLTPEEMNAFFAKLDRHFAAFQQQFPEAQGFSRELVGNVMTYTIPEQHYGAFVQSLVKEGLAPASVLQQLNDVKAQQALQQTLNVQPTENARPQSPLLACSIFAKPMFSGGASKPADEEKQTAGLSFGRNAAAAA